MGKTVQIDDDVMRAAERLAAERGVTPDQVISELARKALADPAETVGPCGTILKNGWYVLPKRGGETVTSELVRRLLDDADLEDAGIKPGDK
ncbi:MAG TPA: CopG family transcriptional regulator [Pseudolabrys sp.]